MAAAKRQTEVSWISLRVGGYLMQSLHLTNELCRWWYHGNCTV